LTAFEGLLKNLPDLVLDTPDAATVLGNFIARAVADDCLPPKFVQICKDKVTCDHAR
jgi:programmed cell death protein 4